MIRPFSFAIATVLFVSCVADGPQSQDSKAGEYTLPLIETTDIHGHILSTDNNGTVHYGMAYIANKVKDVRGRGESYIREQAFPTSFPESLCLCAWTKWITMPLPLETTNLTGA